MAVSINWATREITIPKADLTLVTGSLYELDTDALRLELKDIEDSEEGVPFPDTHRHNTEVTVAGVTYARVIEIINGYSLTFEDGQYSVRLAGSNNNFFDVENGILNQNQVQVIPGNAAGLIVRSIGSGLNTEEHDKLMGLPEESEITADIDANSTQLAAIKERTDNLPDAPADVSDIPTAEENADAVWNKTLP